MKHTEYRRASMRHLSTCNILLKSLETVKAEDKQKIVYNIYYLSGYIIETCLNYAFFCSVNHKDEVENHSDYHKKGIKNHDFDTKIKCIKKRGGDLSGLPFINYTHQDRQLHKLYQMWSTDLRYHVSKENVTINDQIINNFLNEVNTIYKIILRRY